MSTDRAARQILATPARMAALRKAPDAHKYDHGHALVLAGGPGHGGAARLAARGALRIGAGLVTVAAPASAMAENASQLTAIMLRELAGADALSAMLEDQRLSALCLGPGLGRGAETRALVLAALRARRATVLDADALSSFQDTPEALFDALHKQVILTPHSGEFARLFGELAGLGEGLEARAQAVSDAAKRAGCTVLLKGADTLIASADGALSLHSARGPRAAPWLATAGSGDVLAGFITGLLARGFAPHQAAETGTLLHVDCALEFGPGLIAEDLPEALPALLRKRGV